MTYKKLLKQIGYEHFIDNYKVFKEPISSEEKVNRIVASNSLRYDIELATKIVNLAEQISNLDLALIFIINKAKPGLKYKAERAKEEINYDEF